MPRVSAQHEQAVRARILDAAIKVFGEMGYDRASIQDVVRESGLSVGAVYTHFKGKEELFLVACACEAEQQASDLKLRMSEIGSLPDRLRIAVDWAVQSAVGGGTAKSALAHAWPHADSSPDLRRILRDRRMEMVGFATTLLTEAVVSGELPVWIDTAAIASAWITLIDGFSIRASEEGGISPEDARREAYSLLELVLAAPETMPAAVARVRRAGGAALDGVDSAIAE
jgi:TetR/AcrR family transcriptional regulator, transcriptional repressor of aconitase